jgi:hypothetical protein
MQSFTVFFIIVNYLNSNSTTLAVAANKPVTYQMLCAQLLMMGGKTARNI